MRNLFCLKSKNPHPVCVIYEGACACKENILGKLNEIMKFDEKYTQKLTKYLNHLNK